MGEIFVITHREVGTGKEINPKICTGSIRGLRDTVTTGTVLVRSKNSFLHL